MNGRHGLLILAIGTFLVGSTAGYLDLGSERLFAGLLVVGILTLVVSAAKNQYTAP